jgi:hypothetical protein
MRRLWPLALLVVAGCVPVPWFTGFNWSDSMRFTATDVTAYCNENYFTTQAGREIGRALISGAFPAIEFAVTCPDAQCSQRQTDDNGRAPMWVRVWYTDPPVACTPGYWSDVCQDWCPINTGICARAHALDAEGVGSSWLEAKYVTFGVSSFFSWRWQVHIELGNGESFNLRKRALYDGGGDTMSVNRPDCNISSSWFWQCLTSNTERCLLF